MLKFVFMSHYSSHEFMESHQFLLNEAQFSSIAKSELEVLVIIAGYAVFKMKQIQVLCSSCSNVLELPEKLNFDENY